LNRRGLASTSVHAGPLRKWEGSPVPIYRAGWMRDCAWLHPVSCFEMRIACSWRGWPGSCMDGLTARSTTTGRQESAPRCSDGPACQSVWRPLLSRAIGFNERQLSLATLSPRLRGANQHLQGQKRSMLFESSDSKPAKLRLPVNRNRGTRPGDYLGTGRRYPPSGVLLGLFNGLQLPGARQTRRNYCALAKMRLSSGVRCRGASLPVRDAGPPHGVTSRRRLTRMGVRTETYRDRRHGCGSHCSPQITQAATVVDRLRLFSRPLRLTGRGLGSPVGTGLAAVLGLPSGPSFDCRSSASMRARRPSS
jgi:hypothetical protein